MLRRILMTIVCLGVVFVAAACTASPTARTKPPSIARYNSADATAGVTFQLAVTVTYPNRNARVTMTINNSRHSAIAAANQYAFSKVVPIELQALNPKGDVEWSSTPSSTIRVIPGFSASVIKSGSTFERHITFVVPASATRIQAYTGSFSLDLSHPGSYGSFLVRPLQAGVNISG
jgi:hypothetical protein